jgi:hypothetical protein
MSDFSKDEVLEAYDKMIAVRDRVEAGELGWDALGEFFTEDATFIDPAWGRVTGIDAILEFLVESMAGLEGWTFPRQWTMVDGHRLVSMWQNRLPGCRADGSYYEAPGLSVLEYAGNGKFAREEDILNMAHVTELIRESGWKPSPGFNLPPATPVR